MASPKQTLYLGDLPPQTTDAELSAYLTGLQISMTNFKLISRDPTRYAYAYINFQTSSDVNDAINKIEGAAYKFQNRYIRASKFNQNLNRGLKTNLFVKGLPETTQPNDLKDLFTDFGTVISTKVAYDENNKCRGYGFVDFEEEESAKKAINNKDIRISGQLVSVEYFKRRSERKDNFTNLYTKEFPDSYGVEELKKLFGEYGTITSSCLKTDNKDRKFAYINFDTHENAQKAIEALNNKLIEGKNLFVGRHLSKERRKEENQKNYEKRKAENKEKYKNCNLFIKNIPEDIKTTEDLKKLFEQYGTILSAINIGEKYPNKRIGFVAFTSSDDALKAMKEVNARMQNSDLKPIVVQLAMTKEERSQIYMQTNISRAETQMLKYLMPMQPGFNMRFGYQPFMIPSHQQNRAMNKRGMPQRKPQMGYMPMPQVPQMKKQVQAQPPVQQPYPKNPAQQEMATMVEQRQEENANDIKQELGEAIYEHLSQQPRYNEHAGKLTGIIISSLPINELRICVENKNILDKRVEEAYALVLSESSN